MSDPWKNPAFLTDDQYKDDPMPMLWRLLVLILLVVVILASVITYALW